MMILLAAALLTFPRLAADADQARQSNQNARALELYRKAIAVKPDWAEGLWYLSTLLYEQKQFPAARDTLRRFVAQQPEAGPGWALLGLSEVQTHEYARALKHLQQSMALGLGERDSLAQSVFYYAGALLNREERFEESIDLLSKAVRVNPSGTFIDVLGLAGLRLPYLPAETPERLRPVVHAAGQAVYLLANRRTEEANRAFASLTETHGAQSGVHFLNGAYFAMEQPERAIAEFQRELELTPDHVAARIRLAEEYAKRGRLDAALPLSQEALTLDPTSAAAHLELGAILFSNADVPGAIQHLEAAREHGPSSPRLHLLLFRAYSAAGQSSAADREKAELDSIARQAAQ